MSAPRKKGPAKTRASGPTQPESKRKRIVVPVRLSRDVVAELRMLAEGAGVSVSSVVELCVALGMRSDALPGLLAARGAGGAGRAVNAERVKISDAIASTAAAFDELITSGDVVLRPDNAWHSQRIGRSPWDVRLKGASLEFRGVETRRSSGEYHGVIPR